MLRFAVLFFILALISAVLGFGGLASSAAGIATILFYAFLVVALVTGIIHLLR